MSGRILVADDSVTVQKVIEMTLSSEDCTLESCLNEDLLLKKLHSDEYDLLVMDFNLSPERSGLEIATEIYQLFPEMPVMVMLGTFDSFDESSWGKTGIKDKIVKPFNSKEFVEKCLKLLRKDEGMGAHDHWSIDGGEADWKFQGDEDEADSGAGMKFMLDGDKLQREVQDWGIGLPEIIGADEISTSMDSLPDVIEGAAKSIKPVESTPTEDENPKDNFDVDKFWSVDSQELDAEAAVDEKAANEGIKSFQLDDDAMVDKIQDALRPALEGIVKAILLSKSRRDRLGGDSGFGGESD